jgi:hypothetical protein
MQRRTGAAAGRGPRLRLRRAQGRALRAAGRCARAGQTASLVSKYRPPQPIMTLVVPQLKNDGFKWHLEGRDTARRCLIQRGLLPVLAAPSPSGARRGPAPGPALRARPPLPLACGGRSAFASLQRVLEQAAAAGGRNAGHPLAASVMRSAACRPAGRRFALQRHAAWSWPSCPH